MREYLVDITLCRLSVSRSYVLLQRPIRAVKWWQRTVSVFLYIDTRIILISDVITTDHCDSSRNDAVSAFKVDCGKPILEVHEFSKACLPVEVKCAVKFSTTDAFKFVTKWRKRYNGHLWESQTWSFVRTAIVAVSCVFFNLQKLPHRVLSLRATATFQGLSVMFHWRPTQETFWLCDSVLFQCR